MNFFYDELRKQLEKLKQINNSFNALNRFYNSNNNNLFNTPKQNSASNFSQSPNFNFNLISDTQNSIQKPLGRIVPESPTNWKTTGIIPDQTKLIIKDIWGENTNTASAALDKSTLNNFQEQTGDIQSSHAYHKDMNKNSKADYFKTMQQDLGKLKQKEQIENYKHGDWQYLDHNFDKPSHYRAVTMKNDKTGEIAVFNMGTNKWSPKDLWTDAQMVFNRIPEQFDEAKNYHKSIKKKYGENYKINSIGHSEGGSESQYVGIHDPEIDVYTYNAYGIGRNKEAKNPAHNLSNIYNVRNSNDPVSKHGKDIGYTDVIESNKKRRPLFFGYFDEHKLENMGDIKKAVPIEEYKKQHPNFVNNMNDILLTSDDVGKMDLETFRFYEPYIDDMLRRRALMPSYELNRRIANGENIRFNNGYYQFI